MNAPVHVDPTSDAYATPLDQIDVSEPRSRVPLMDVPKGNHRNFIHGITEMMVRIPG